MHRDSPSELPLPLRSPDQRWTRYLLPIHLVGLCIPNDLVLFTRTSGCFGLGQHSDDWIPPVDNGKHL